MSGEMEAAGAMATAGLIAGAIEGRETTRPGEGGCLNCGAALAGPYCSQCGQAAQPHRSLARVLEEFLHGIFHFDTKVWRTLPMVFFRPGTLTRNYVFGKRARYVSPLAFFLLAIFFMFAVFAFAGGDAPVNVTENTTVAEAQAELEEARAELAEAETALAAVLENPDPDQPPGLEQGMARQAVGLAQGAVARAEAAVRRAERRASDAAREAEREQAAATEEPATASAPEAATATPATPADSDAQPPAGPVAINQPDSNAPVQISTGDADNVTWQDAVRQVAESDDFVVVHGWDFFNERVRAQLRNPDLAAYRISEAASKFSFLLVPLSLPFIALVFLWKRGVTLYDHVVFALYELSFVSFLFVGIVLAVQVEWLIWVAPVSILIALPVHTFFHLGGAYALGWFSALWRTILLLFFSMFTLIIFLIIIIILGLVG